MRRPLAALSATLESTLESLKVGPALSAGLTAGLGLVVAQIAFATYLFSGRLADYSTQGIGLILFGNFAGCLVIALTSGYRGAVGGLSPVLLIAMVEVASTLPADGRALFVTTAFTLIVSAVAAGLVAVAIGRFQLAHLLRFIPYSVASGCVAGIGAAVCLAAMSLMGAELSWQTLPALAERPQLVRWTPGVLYGIGLYVAVKKWSSPIIPPASIVLAIGAGHFVLAYLGVPADEARSPGLLLASTGEGGLWPPLLPADLVDVDWGAVVAQTPDMMMLVVVALFCVIMSVAGLEVATRQDLDWDREFTAAGTASVVAGLGGGMAVNLIVPASLRSKMFGATTPLTGVVAALSVGGVLFLGDAMLGLIPVFLVGGIVVFAGCGMLEQGLVRNWRALPRAEYGIILLIATTIAGFGLVKGVAVGMLATLVLFALRLSRMELVKSQFTASERRSSRVRPAPDRAILLEYGDRIRCYCLRGYIFFGGIGPLVDRFRRFLDEGPRPACLILDFRDVSGVDISAVNALSRFLAAADSAGLHLVLSGVPEPLQAGLERSLPPSLHARLRVTPNEDRALEFCEDEILGYWQDQLERAKGRRSALFDRVSGDLERQLERQIEFEDLVQELDPWLRPRLYAAGESLAGPDALVEGIQLLVSGLASACDHKGARLYQYGPGDPVWPSERQGDGATSVVADNPCRAVVLGPEDRRWLESHRQALIVRLYRYLLAERVSGSPPAR